MKLTLGLDVEFCFTDTQNRIVSASNFLSGTGQLGTDACSAIAEVRPRYSEEPKKVTTNIIRIFKRYSDRIPQILELNWRTGSFVGGRPIGGHMHFGFVREGETEPRHPEYRRLCKLLDTYLVPLVILLEDTQESRDRKRTGYGALSGYRPQPWGLEYRTLPSFLASPFMVDAILSIAKVVVWEAWKYPEFSVKPIVLANAYAKGVFRKRFESCDKAYFNRLRIQVMKGLEEMELYPTYERIICKFNRFLSGNLGEFSFSKVLDFKEAWGLKPVVIEQIEVKTAEEVWNDI